MTIYAYWCHVSMNFNIGVLHVFIDVHLHIQYLYYIYFPEKGRCQIIPTVFTADVLVIVIRGSIQSGPTQILCSCYLIGSGCITCRFKAVFLIFCHLLSTKSSVKNIIIIRNGLCRSLKFDVYHIYSDNISIY